MRRDLSYYNHALNALVIDFKHQCEELELVAQHIKDNGGTVDPVSEIKLNTALGMLSIIHNAFTNLVKDSK